MPQSSAARRPVLGSGASDADARQAILVAAIATIEEGGLADVSMREVARRAGVSHQLPYHYFVDREGILAAIAERGFEILCDRMRSAYEGPGSGPERMAAAGRAYVEFACEHRAHFRVMFRRDFVPLANHPAAHARADECFAWVPELVADCVREGLPPVPDPQSLVILGWSIAHGLACLLLDGPLETKLPEAAEAKEATVRRVMEAMKLLLERSSLPVRTATATFPAKKPSGKRHRREPVT